MKAVSGSDGPADISAVERGLESPNDAMLCAWELFDCARALRTWRLNHEIALKPAKID
eukprot:m.61747 g.61747  ORF g.61747 m.61747 type:complete len:58 (-) comp15771_c0_seq1:1731-1904(-)